HVPDDRAEIGREIFHHAAHRLDKSIDGVRWLPAGVRQFADRKERAIDVVVAVDEEELHGWKKWMLNSYLFSPPHARAQVADRARVIRRADAPRLVAACGEWRRCRARVRAGRLARRYCSAGAQSSAAGRACATRRAAT